MVVFDYSRLDEQNCRGTLAIVIETLPPISNRIDQMVERNISPQAKVKESWTVSPSEKSVQVFLLDGNLFQPHEVYSATDIAKDNSLDGCFIELSKVFTDN